jgi:hypothetical protein
VAVEIVGIGTETRMEPDPTTGKITQYQIDRYSDGRVVTSRWDPAQNGGQGAWVTVGTKMDEAVRKQHDAAVAAERSQGEGKIVTLPDGRKARVEGNSLVPLEGQEPRTPATRQLVWVDDKPYVFDPESGVFTAAAGLPARTPKPEAAAAPKAGNVPGVSLGAPRPGQRTDLRSLEAGWNAQIAAWNADTSLDADGRGAERRNALFQKLYQEEILPAAQRAQQEATEYALEQERRQREQDEAARETRERTRTTEERRAGIEEEGLALRRGELERNVRSDAVQAALDLLPYQAGPTFSADLAGVYNRILPGAFSPGAFSVNLPDLNAVADEAVKRMVALHGTAVPERTAAAALPSAAGGTGLTATPATRDQWAVPPVGARPGGAVPALPMPGPVPDPNVGPYPGSLPPALTPNPNVGPYPGALPQPVADPLAALGFTPRRGYTPAPWPPGITH